MWRRGANLEGDTANFVETEQLLELEGYKCSLLQVELRCLIRLLMYQHCSLSQYQQIVITSIRKLFHLHAY